MGEGIVGFIFCYWIICLIMHQWEISFVALISFIIGIVILEKKGNKKDKNNDIQNNDILNINETETQEDIPSIGTIWNIENNKKDKSRYTDAELNVYCLEDWQKKLVQEGKYDPWNFEEEDLEEDDYYYEDDD